jgi:hypothetical protein
MYVAHQFDGKRCWQHHRDAGNVGLVAVVSAREFIAVVVAVVAGAIGGDQLGEAIGGIVAEVVTCEGIDAGWNRSILKCEKMKVFYPANAAKIVIPIYNSYFQ